jgi:hypothetical protein
MPISEEEWKTGGEAVSLVRAIFRYLNENYPKAYTSTDIVEELFETEESEIQYSILVSLIISNLEILIDKGAIEAKLVDNDEYEGMTYYRRAEDVDSLEGRRQ